MKIVTRFAPSPTGFLHIGSARTALFNYLFAKHNKGSFLLRIEDTDHARSTQEANEAILSGLKWLGLDYDGELIYQSKRAERHSEIADKLVKLDKAYYCYQTQEETDVLRKEAEAKGRVYQYNKKWRDTSLIPPENVKPVIRLKIEENLITNFTDLVQGEVSYSNNELEDLVLLRSDGTPTYMLAVVVDDHDMEITHVIRGDDHLTNSFKQIQIYNALEWNLPQFAHIPLIHGSDGAKLSKRHGALGVDSYKEMGYLPEAINNYLLRLGWSHGDDEFISRDEAIKWFNLDHVGKSPSRMDFKKLENVNAHYIKLTSNENLLKITKPILEDKLSTNLTHEKFIILLEAFDDLKLRAKTLIELADMSAYYIQKPRIGNDLKSTLTELSFKYLDEIRNDLTNIKIWEETTIDSYLKEFAKSKNIEFGVIGGLMRIVLTGTRGAPGIVKIIKLLGLDEVIYRIQNIE